MRYTFRLAELLGHTPDRRRRPGTIKAIVDHTGLDRHQVASLLKNESKYIPIEALSRICDYLIDQNLVPAEKLPGALFAIQPENFWEMLARRRRVELCMGVRRGEADSPDNAWVVASDSVLMGELLNGISTLGGTAHHKVPSLDEVTGDGSPVEGEEGEPMVPLSQSSPQPDRLQQTLVWSPGQVPEKTVQARAGQVYRDFSALQADKALVCMGSLKSNPVVEIIFAETFGCDPFVSQDDVESASDRSCPFFLRYRDSDPHPDAATAGLRLSKSESADRPGIYYEQEDGSWTWAGGAEGKDTALVFYVYREPLGRLEMVFSGFSGRATRLLSRTLAARAEDFWPPIYEEADLQIGAFIVQYEAKSTRAREGDLLQTNVSAGTTIFRLPGAAIRRRLHGED